MAVAHQPGDSISAPLEKGSELGGRGLRGRRHHGSHLLTWVGQPGETTAKHTLNINHELSHL